MSLSIPIVSFSPFLTGDRASQAEVAKAVYDAFSTVGFIYLKDCGIPQGKVDEIFELVSYVAVMRGWKYGDADLIILGSWKGMQGGVYGGVG